MTRKTGTFFDYVIKDAASEKKLPMRSVWDMPRLIDAYANTLESWAMWI